MTKITNDVYSVGILNPNLRVFDIIMKTEFGTSYNSYIIKSGDEAILVETTHPRYFDLYLKNILEVCPLQNIKYIVMHHNEPDHSGCLERLLELVPNAQVVTSQAGSIYLKTITNKSDLNVKLVKDGDSITCGEKELKFISAPFLHWPDSIFSYLEDEKTLFSCDFLGSHYCEPGVLDTHIAYEEDYKAAFSGYYKAIFGPFKPYVLAGLDKIKDLNLDFICTSHGPVLTKNGKLNYATELYRKWSIKKPKEKKSIPIFYCSAYGNTEAIANEIAKGIGSVIADADVKTYNIIEHDMEKLQEIMNESDAFLIGSPTLNRDAVPPVWILLAHLDAINNQKKKTAVFGSFGWSGEAVGMVSDRLKALKLDVFEAGLKINFVPSKTDLQKASDFGTEFAKTL